MPVIKSPTEPGARLCQNPPLKVFLCFQQPLACMAMLPSLPENTQPARPPWAQAHRSRGQPAAAASRQGAPPTGGCLPVRSRGTPAAPSPVLACGTPPPPTTVASSHTGVPPPACAASSPQAGGARAAPWPPTEAHRPTGSSAAPLDGVCPAAEAPGGASGSPPASGDPAAASFTATATPHGGGSPVPGDDATGDGRESRQWRVATDPPGQRQGGLWQRVWPAASPGS